MSWAAHLFSLELRKLLSYRVDFWLGFFGSIFAEMFVAYFVWKAVFDLRGVSEVGGFTFHGMLLYYFLVALSQRCISVIDHDFVAGEIYDGSLTRYLVYPVSFFGYKFVMWLAGSIMAFIQLAFSFALFIAIFGVPADCVLSVQSVILGVATLLAASSLCYSLVISVDMVSFWAENVWSLQVMVRFVTRLLGGGLLPLVLFPVWSKPLIRLLPFPYLIDFPVRTLMGKVPLAEWVPAMAALVAWSVVFRLIAQKIWNRGSTQYGGVGI